MAVYVQKETKNAHWKTPRRQLEATKSVREGSRRGFMFVPLQLKQHNTPAAAAVATETVRRVRQ